MSTHNICFCGEITKISVIFLVEKSTLSEISVAKFMYFGRSCIRYIYVSITTRC